jgi:hypothetical protein
MAFATAGNFDPVNIVISNSDSVSYKAYAQLIVFPEITGRDAPGKTGSSAKPALVSSIGLEVSAGAPNVTGTLSIWSLGGKNRVTSSVFTFQNNATPIAENKTIPGRAVFSGAQYRVGFSKVSTGTFRFGAVQTVGADFGLNAVGFVNTEPDFSAISFDRFDLKFPWRLDYDVLPTQPLNLTGVLSGPNTDQLTLNWDAVASDGGQAVSGYRIQQSLDNVTWTTLVANTGTATRSFTTSELNPGIRYYFRVAAINAVAIAHGSSYSGPYSTSVETIVPTVPGNALSFLTATVTNPDPLPLAFSDFGSGIRFTKIDVQYGSEFLYTEIEASTQDDAAVLQTIDAPLSKALYGVRSYSITNLLNSTDLGAFEVAKDYLTYYYQPELRVQSITVDLSNLTIEQKLLVLGLEIDSFITVSFTPNGVGDPKVASGLVTGISHRITLTSHEVELRLRNERNLFTLNSDSKGILNVNTLGP